MALVEGGQNDDATIYGSAVAAIGDMVRHGWEIRNLDEMAGLPDVSLVAFHSRCGASPLFLRGELTPDAAFTAWWWGS